MLLLPIPYSLHGVFDLAQDVGVVDGGGHAILLSIRDVMYGAPQDLAGGGPGSRATTAFSNASHDGPGGVGDDIEQQLNPTQECQSMADPLPGFFLG